MRTLEVPERIIGGFYIMDVPNIPQGSYVSIYITLPSMESGPTPGFSRASSKESKWTLVVLKGILVVFDIINVPMILSKLRINFQISTFLESGLTPGFSIA
jgi:hypothetical protein